MQSFIDFFRPPDDNPKAKSIWRFNVSIALMLTAVLGGGAYFGPWKVAFASEVDQKINTAKAELSKEIKAVDSRVVEQGLKIDGINQKLSDALAEGVAAQIRLQISKRCKTQGFVERDELTREIDRLQGVYKGFKREPYREPSCADL